MSYKKYATPLGIRIIPSHKLLLLVCFVHGGGLGVVWLTALPLAGKLLLSFAILVSLIMFWASNGYMQSFKSLRKMYPAVREVVWGSDNEWLLVNETGKESKAQLRSVSFIHPRLTVVLLKLADQPWYRRNRSLVFLEDNIDDESFRRLRVRLRWYSTPEQDNSLALK